MKNKKGALVCRPHKYCAIRIKNAFVLVDSLLCAIAKLEIYGSALILV
jgi:hypothetical protein